MFCGAVLIDMIDNDIERASKDFEFGNVGQADQLRQYNDPSKSLRMCDEEW